MATAGCPQRHQHHPPVHLRLQLIILLLCSCSAPAPSRSSPITIVLSHPHVELPLTPADNGSDPFVASTAEDANANTSTTEILHGNNSDSDNQFNHGPGPAAAPSTALVKTRARATSLPRQEFYLQDKRTGSGSASSSDSATTTSAKHVLEILEGYTPHGGVDNVSIRHGYGYGFGYGSGDADGDDYGQFGDRIVIRIDDEDGATYRVRKLPVVNSFFQFGLLLVILLVSLIANGVVIVNVSRDSLKLKMTHFLLIRHVCVTDFLGALFILPLPMVAIVRGEWTESATSNRICAAVATTTALFWTMHLIAVALYRTDRVLAVWLPSGRYPICSVRSVHICLVSVWLTAIVGSCLATFTFGYTFQPALALCIPDVPIIFFIVVFSGYCIALIALSTGYILAFARKRKRRRRSKKEMLQAQMAAAVGAAQRCLLYATTGGSSTRDAVAAAATPPPIGNHNNNSLSLGPTPVQNNAAVEAAAAEQRRQRQEEAFTLRSESYDSPFVALANHSVGGRVVNVLQHQMTGFSDDFVPPQLAGGSLSPEVQDLHANDGDFYTSKCIRNSSSDPPPGADDPDKTPTPAPVQATPQFGFGGNVNALPSCTITPNRPSPLVALAFPEPADDASTADSAEESAATPTGPPPPPPQQPEEPAVKCPHHFLEQGYQVLRSSSSERTSSSSSSDSDSEASRGSASRMLPARAGTEDGGGSGSGLDKKKILRTKKPGSGSARTRSRIARITHQSFSLTFSNTNSASAPGRVKSAGAGGRTHAWRIPAHSKSFDCYYDLLEQRPDDEATEPMAEGFERPHSVHVPMEPDADPDANPGEFGHEDLEMALVQTPQAEPRSESRQSRASSHRIRIPTQIMLNPDGEVDAGGGGDADEGSGFRSRLSNSSSKCSSAYNNGNGNGTGNGTYSNSLNTQDGEEGEEEEDHSPYIDVIHDQIDHFRFHVQERHSSHGYRPRSASSEKGKFILHHSLGLETAKGKGKKRQRHGHKHGHHGHGHHHTRHKHAKKSTDAKKRALLSYALSVGHLLLYLPAMFVIGLSGASLPPGAALFCGIVVYCEFLIQPSALMILSHRLRTEITRMIRRQPSTLAITEREPAEWSRNNQLI